MKIHKTFLAAVCFILLIICVSAQEIENNKADYCDSFLRLHIVASSDSEYDQRLKLAVRDELMPKIEAVFSSCKSFDEALEIANEYKNTIVHDAERLLISKGCDEKVTVVLGKEYYDERVYQNRTFPQGEYLSLRILIGEAQGHNWWCILYPNTKGVGVEYNNVENDGGFEIFGCKIKFRLFDCFK